MTNPNIIILITAGIGFILLLVGMIVSRTSQSVVEERLGRYSEGGGYTGQAVVADRVREERASPVADFLDRVGEGSNLFDNIAKNLAQADLKFRASEFLMLIVLAAVVMTFAGYIISSSIPFAILGGIFGAFLPQLYVARSKSQRLKNFNNQLGDMLNLMVNGLRAGYSTMQAMEAVSKELPSPISVEFRRVVQEMQLGLSMEDALDHLVRRITSDDLDLVITAINVQREVGGNLAEILDVISYTIRERVRIQGEIAALTAQGRATAWVISALPIILVLLLFLINRPYIMQFFNPETRGCGIPIIVLAGIMVLIGFAVVQKIVKIDI
jgi:tight adherence protein B